MKNLVVLFFVICATISGVYGDLITSVYVPADGAILSVDTGPGWYDIYASGIFNFGGDKYPWAIADAEWVQVNDYHWFENGPWQDNLCDLAINETFLDWQGKTASGDYLIHTFSESHEHKITFYTPDELRFWIYDSIYEDNSGGLSVDIHSTVVPEAPTILLFGIGWVLAITIKRKRPFRR